MDIRIGVTYTPKEIALELADGVKPDAVKASVNEAIGNSEGILWLEDAKGRQIGVPSSKIAYVEIGSEDTGRPIGFG